MIAQYNIKFNRSKQLFVGVSLCCWDQFQMSNLTSRVQTGNFGFDSNYSNIGIEPIKSTLIIYFILSISIKYPDLDNSISRYLNCFPILNSYT